MVSNENCEDVENRHSSNSYMLKATSERIEMINNLNSSIKLPTLHCHQATFNFITSSSAPFNRPSVPL